MLRTCVRHGPAHPGERDGHRRGQGSCDGGRVPPDVSRRADVRDALRGAVSIVRLCHDTDGAQTLPARDQQPQQVTER